MNADTLFDLYFESFRRRLSFISIANPDIRFELELDGNRVMLDNKNRLFKRPANEIIRSKFSEHSDDNNPEHLEKYIQSVLYGKDLKERTNVRLAILGEDFYNMKDKAIGVLREFPTGVFNGKIANATRILPTDWVDIVTQNINGNLAVIELKVNDFQLEVISQILDYCLYFASYRSQISKIENIKNTFDIDKIIKDDIIGYVANNYFHPLFDYIAPFYSTKGKDCGFCLKKVVLGETTEFSEIQISS
jgi:hypothetical protein